MKDYLDQVKNELKRVDHIIYVSLKYTRTVDVIKHGIDRMISAFDVGFEALLEKVKRRRKTLEVPEQPLKRCEVLREIFKDDDEVNKYIDFYLILKRLSKAEFSRVDEYRRNVTMIAKLDTGMMEVTIDKLYEYEITMKEFVSYLENKLGLAKETL